MVMICHTLLKLQARFCHDGNNDGIMGEKFHLGSGMVHVINPKMSGWRIVEHSASPEWQVMGRGSSRNIDMMMHLWMVMVMIWSYLAKTSSKVLP